MSRLDGSEGPAVLGDPLECEPRLSDGVSRQDESEGPDVLCDPLECEPRLGDGEDVDSLGDDLENANGTVVADETDRDVKAVQSQRRHLFFVPVSVTMFCQAVATGDNSSRLFLKRKIG